MFSRLLLLILLACLAHGQGSAPKLSLPWGTWQATRYDKLGDFWTFENVRFGKAPVGDLRFVRSTFPDSVKQPVLQNSSYGPSCLQVDASKKCTPGGNLALTPAGCTPVETGEQSEDCLFLDLYVPASVFTRNVTNLPVVVWIHGGAYVFGSKNAYNDVNVPLYNLTGVARTANGAGLSTIYVAGNYRLGALGWLAGTYMEFLAPGLAATPNAGFYDQQLLLAWIQLYIGQVGGNRNNVSAWGESAGAGSIFHHLLAYNGTVNPTFKRAILQSPAFEWQWDRAGTMNEVYRNFSRIAKCGDTFNITCLKKLTTAQIQTANQQLFETGTKCTGLYPLGPALDGILFNQLPPVAFANGNYWKNIDSLIVSHVGNETASFIPPYIRPDYPSDFDYFLKSLMPEPVLSGVRQAITNQYPVSKYPNQAYRAMILIRDSTFTCNTRQLFDAYFNIIGNKMYMMQYNMLQDKNLDVHASDLLPLFYNSNVNLTFWLETCLNLPWYEADPAASAIKELSSEYQAKWIRHAITGNPNDPDSGWFDWYQAYASAWHGSVYPLTDVMEVGGDDVSGGPFFGPFSTDYINTREACGFWDLVAQEITRLSQRQQNDGGESLFVQEGGSLAHAEEL